MSRPGLLGRRYGDWYVRRVVDTAGDRADRIYELECLRCGRLIERSISSLRSLAGCRCDEDLEDAQPPPPDGVLVEGWTSWEQDDRCWLVVELHPEGLKLPQIGELMGITRERVRQIEASGLRKARVACEREGVTLEEWLECVAGHGRAEGHPLVQVLEAG